MSRRKSSFFAVVCTSCAVSMAAPVISQFACNSPTIPPAATATQAAHYRSEAIASEPLNPDARDELPAGITAIWSAGGTGTIGENGVSGITTLVLTAGSELNATLQVDAKASIGAKCVNLLNTQVDLAPGESISYPLDLAKALSLDDKQLSYATSISTRVSAVTLGGQAGLAINMPLRYLILRSDLPSSEVMDEASLKTTYPNGITTADERERVQALLAAQPTEEGVSAGIGSGVFVVNPETRNMSDD